MNSFPRVMLAAPASGTGKTLITCGLLSALVKRGLGVSSFKCGPDYIDPMFHKKVIGTASSNLDSFFVDQDTLRYLFGRSAEGSDISVIEGVMGFFDGLGGTHTEASSYDVASITKTPVIMVVNAKGMSRTLVPIIKGLSEYKPNSCCQSTPDSSDCGINDQSLCTKNNGVKAVILNQVAASIYPELKEMIESETSVKVVGYVPNVKDCVIESRHLGLVTPDEITDIKERLDKLADILEETLDIDGIIEIAKNAQEICTEIPKQLDNLISEYKESAKAVKTENTEVKTDSIETAIVSDLDNTNSIFCGDADNEVNSLKIAIAKDSAFCFYYEDNFRLLKSLGAELIEFSPLKDDKLPEGINGIIIGGGYPELYAKELSENTSMLKSIKSAMEAGIPCLAECGGFMYLNQSMEDMKGDKYPMVGSLYGNVYKTNRLGRFGYIDLTMYRDNKFLPEGETIKGHEFHYFDCTENGDTFQSTKPFRNKNWVCEVANYYQLAGFPHLYYYSNPKFVMRFLDACKKWENSKITD